jgi:hypothetical protein
MARQRGQTGYQNMPVAQPAKWMLFFAFDSDLSFGNDVLS